MIMFQLLGQHLSIYYVIVLDAMEFSRAEYQCKEFRANFPVSDAGLLYLLTKCERSIEVFNEKLIGIARVSLKSISDTALKLQVLFSPVAKQVS